MKHPLSLGVRLDQPDRRRGTARQLEIADGFGVDREQAAGRAIFGGHVGERGPIGQWQAGQSGSVIFDKLAHDAFFSEHLGGGQHQIGGRGTFAQCAGELEADDLGHEHRHRLAQHGGLGLDSADPPSQHAQPVDHGGVRVGADQGIRIRQGWAARLIGRENHARQILEVHLVDDAGIGRDDSEILEGVLPPAEKRVPLAIPLKFQLGVGRECVRRAGLIDLDRVVDDQLDRLERVDFPRVASQPVHRVAHGGQVDDRRHAREILQQHPAGPKRDLAVRLGLGVPVGQGLDVVGRDCQPILIAEQVLQQDLQ